MKIHSIIIGDEILNGNRVDKHLPHIIQTLKKRGLCLHSAQYVGDDLNVIVDALKYSISLYNNENDVVLCFGGIGSTPDDRTRQAAAVAFNQKLMLHAQAKECITQRIQQMHIEGKAPADLNHPDNIHRFTMGEFPQQANIIPNTYNLIPAFYINNHYFMPGFPVIAWPMLDWILDTHYTSFHHMQTEQHMCFCVVNMPEGQLAPILFETERLFTEIKTYSLPSFGNIDKGNTQNNNTQDNWQNKPHIEVGVKAMHNSDVTTDILKQSLMYIAEQVEKKGYTIIVND